MEAFAGRVAVVTGGASGIGLALARAFAAEGAKVVLADVQDAALESAARGLREGGARVLAVRTDVTKPESVEALAERTYAEFGACHVLCNNAGVGAPSGKLWESTPNDWRWLLSVNVAGVVHGIQSFVPRMLAGGEEGVVVNTSSSNGGISPLADAAAYAASKAAVSTLTECLDAQLTGGASKLRAAIFYPSGGLLDTGIWSCGERRPAEFARERAVPPGGAVGLDEFRERMKKLGRDLPLQDLDELARFALDGIRKRDFVIMIGRETMEPQLVARSAKLAKGECPIS